jgi:hypothetical protein
MGIGSLSQAQVLYLARGFQGLGDAFLFPLSLAIIAMAFDGKERGTAIQETTVGPGPSSPQRVASCAAVRRPVRVATEIFEPCVAGNDTGIAPIDSDPMPAVAGRGSERATADASEPWIPQAIAPAEPARRIPNRARRGAEGGNAAHIDDSFLAAGTNGR